MRPPSNLMSVGPHSSCPIALIHRTASCSEHCSSCPLYRCGTQNWEASDLLRMSSELIPRTPLWFFVYKPGALSTSRLLFLCVGFVLFFNHCFLFYLFVLFNVNNVNFKLVILGIFFLLIIFFFLLLDLVAYTETVSWYKNGNC